MSNLQISVLIADDQTLFRESLRLYLMQKGFYIAGSVADGFDAVAKALSLKPDVVLMDLQMGMVDGLCAAQKIRENNPNIKVVAITGYGDYMFYSNVRNFFDGYLKKPVALEKIVEAITKVHRGEKFFFDRSKQFEEVEKSMNQIEQEEFEAPELTKKEKELINCVFEGLDNAEISDRLSIAISTVKTHLRNIFQKCCVSNRKELIKKYMR